MAGNSVGKTTGSERPRCIAAKLRYFTKSVFPLSFLSHQRRGGKALLVVDGILTQADRGLVFILIY